MPTPLTLADLQVALSAVEPAAVLVSPRLLENIIRQTGNLSGWVWRVPHRKSCIIARLALFRYVEQEELSLAPEQELPSTVILLAWPEQEEFEDVDRAPLLLQYWQRLFHESVHLSLENLWSQGKLTAGVIRERLDRLGPACLEEIRTVLVQDEYLIANADERSIYIEFAAVFLELAYFAPHLLPIYFPIIRNVDEVKKLLSQDVPAAQLYERTKLAGAVEPTARTISSYEEAQEYYWKLIRSSEQAAQIGNVVLSAIQRQRAARVAPGLLAASTRQQAVTDLLGLVDRLQKALNLSAPEAEEWRKHLPMLLDKADQGRHPVEATLLYDLQKVCLDYEHEIYALDLVEWVLSAGKRPIKRPLPSQRLVRVTRTLRGIAQRLTMARLSDENRQEFSALLQEAVCRSEERVRQKFRPQLTNAIHDSGLTPEHPLENTALRKVVEELTDRIIDSGFVTFSELRDTLSRNQLKMPDLTNPQDFISGDPLLRLDRLLSTRLDGVYQPGEFYLRWLERITALNFGTPLGRVLTSYGTVPFLGALLVLGLFSKVWEFLDHHLFDMPKFASPQYYYSFGGAGLGLFFLAVIHSQRLRKQVVDAGVAMGRFLRALIVEGPLWILQHTSFKGVIETWTFQLVYYLLKPVLLGGLIILFMPDQYRTPFGIGMVFVATACFLYSRLGQGVSHAMVELLIRFLELLRSGLIPGLLNLIVELLKQLLHFGESLLFSVDEWLRFRGGDSRPTMATRAILSLLWFPIAYLLRFYMVVLIEPAFNPFKLPIASVATKFMVPFLTSIGESLTDLCSPVLGPVLGAVVPNVLITFWLPDAVAFIVWELKENWSLYGANRRQAIRPVTLGRRGETMTQLLHPGFHSGTIPKLFAWLRRAERQARQTGNWSDVRACQSAMGDVEQAIHQFATREFCELLGQTPTWQGHPLRVGKITLATSQIQVELHHPGYPDQPLCLEFENQDAQLVAGIAAPGWAAELPNGQRILLNNALAILYKLAGVDLVREQTFSGLRSSQPSFSLNGQLRNFHDVAITWEECVQCWQTIPTETVPPSLLGNGFDLFPAADRPHSGPLNGSASDSAIKPAGER